MSQINHLNDLGVDSNPVTKVFQERNRKPVSGNRFPVSLLKYLCYRVRIDAKSAPRGTLTQPMGRSFFVGPHNHHQPDNSVHNSHKVTCRGPAPQSGGLPAPTGSRPRKLVPISLFRSQLGASVGRFNYTLVPEGAKNAILARCVRRDTRRGPTRVLES